MNRPALTKLCSYCPRRFSKAEHLKRHERSHTGEKPFQCALCQKQFARGDVLNRHMRAHLESQAAKGENENEKRPAARPRTRTVEDSEEESDPRPSPSNASANNNDGSDVPAQIQTQAVAQSSTINDHAAAGPGLQLQNDNITPESDSEFLPTAAAAGAVPTSTCESPQNQTNSQSLMDCDQVRNVRQVPDLSTEYALGDSNLWMHLLNDHDHTHALPNYPGALSDSGDVDIMDMDMDLYFMAMHQPVQSTQDIPDERFAMVAKLWPTKKNASWRLMDTLWSTAATHPMDNIFARPTPTGQPLSNSTAGITDESRWCINAERRCHLMRECSMSQDSSDTPLFAGQSPNCDGTVHCNGHGTQNFPSTDMLEMSLDIYFRRPYQLMPFVHLPTFSTETASNCLILPMCLLGLTLLDPQTTKKFVATQTTAAMERCRAELQKTRGPNGSISLMGDLATGVLLLILAAIDPERVNAEETQMLYQDLLTVAQKHRLFAPEDSGYLSSAVFQRNWGVDKTWKAWAKVESMKCLIVSLVMVDSFFANKLEVSPIISVETIRFYTPCAAELFQARDSKQWMSLINEGYQVITPLLDLRCFPAILPSVARSSLLGMHGVLATVWLRIADARHRLPLTSAHHDKNRVLVPADLYSDDASAKNLGPHLLHIFITYQDGFQNVNPNCITFWHNMFLSLTADLATFELAAGRGGPARARSALDDIATWAQSSAARRACLHAAQTFQFMSQRRIADGTMFMSEIALFHSALVISLYLYMVPQTDGQKATIGLEPFELLDSVDWAEIGMEGIDYGHTTLDAPKSSACRFIRVGGPLSFAGTVRSGGYYSAQRILLEYVGLLEEVGKWNVGKFCQILRVMSNSIMQTDDG